MAYAVNVLNNHCHAKPMRVLDETEWAMCAQLQLAILWHTQHNLVAAEKFMLHIKG